MGSNGNGKRPVNAFVVAPHCPVCHKVIEKPYPVHRETMHLPDVHHRSENRHPCRIFVTIDPDRTDTCFACSGSDPSCVKCDGRGVICVAAVTSLPPGIRMEEARRHFRVGPYHRP